MKETPSWSARTLFGLWGLCGACHQAPPEPESSQPVVQTTHPQSTAPWSGTQRDSKRAEQRTPEMSSDQSGKCPTGLSGPELIPIDRHYCIDRTEVLGRHYQEFLAATGGRPDKTTDSCDWNQSYTPIIPETDEEFSGIFCPDGQFAPNDRPEEPIVCVDWCDARDYCTWAGKRLCGGRAGEPLSFSDSTDAQKSEWHNVCTAGGSTRYPYGNDYRSGVCLESKGQGYSSGPERQCHGQHEPFSRVHDLVGSVGEWVNVCQGHSCLVRGGTAGQPQRLDGLSCAESAYVNPRETALVGFRCCAGVR